MKVLFSILLISLLIGCKKEKSFADDIILAYPKDTQMKMQEFNEDLDESGGNLLYIGYEQKKIDVKYYEYTIPPPPVIQKLNENDVDYEKRIKKSNDSAKALVKNYFRQEEIPVLFEKRNNSFTDSLSNKNLEIYVKENDTIPLYKKSFYTHEIKKYKAFPVFIKNISNKILKVPAEPIDLMFYFKNERKQYQSLRNSSYLICGWGTNERRYYELKPNQILIYTYPYFKGGEKRSGKLKFHNTSSKNFEISINKKIIDNQRETHLE
jgi:hypothetical protein